MSELTLLRIGCWLALAIWAIAGPLVGWPMVMAAGRFGGEDRPSAIWVWGSLIIAAFNIIEAAVIAWAFQWPLSRELQRYVLFVIPIGLIGRALGFTLMGVFTIGPRNVMRGLASALHWR